MTIKDDRKQTNGQLQVQVAADRSKGREKRGRKKLLEQHEGERKAKVRAAWWY